MRVGHFVSFGIGGADRAAFNILLGLKRQGLNPLVFFNKFSFPTRTPDQDPSQPILNTKHLFDAEFETVQIEICADLNRFELDILHTHRSGEDEWLLPGLGQVKNRKFAIIETNFHGRLKTPADIRVFPTETLMNFRRIQSSSTFLAIPNAIMEPLTEENFRDRLNVSSETIILGRVARADKSIYSPKLLKAFAALAKQKKVHLVWVGASAKAVNDATKLGISEITWVDPIASPLEVSKWYNTFDIYCHANKLGETFGNTVAEAMIHGKPVISLAGKRTYPQAQFELLSDARQCASNTRSFRGALFQMVSSAHLRRNLGEANRSRALAEYGIDSVARKYLKLYQNTIEIR